MGSSKHRNNCYISLINILLIDPLVLLGGCVAAAAAQAHFTTDTRMSETTRYSHVAHRISPAMHPDSFTIKVTDLKIGKGSCFIRLDLSQKGEPKCLALATSTNFTVQSGPSAKTNVPFLPALPPSPDLNRIEAYEPDEK